jgi:RNA polymerase sigma factor (sigma-70 family)
LIEGSDLINLFNDYSNMVYRLAYSYLRNAHDAEDVVQVVFMKLIEGKATIIPDKERALLIQITINYCKDILRSFWKKKNEPLNENLVFEEKSDSELFDVVMSLPVKYRIVVYLHYYEGLYIFRNINVLENKLIGCFYAVASCKKNFKNKVRRRW